MGGVLSGPMGDLGYPGEIQDNSALRWFWWACAMLPFLFVVNTVVAGLNEAVSKQPEEAQGLVNAARYLTAISWLTYPGVYIIKMVGLSGTSATTYEQIGFSISDVTAKAVFGILIWAIASTKSDAEEKAGLVA